LQGFQHSLPAEPVQRPEQNKFKFPSCGRSEQALELLPVAVLPRGGVHVFENDPPALRGGKGSKLGELVLVVLLVGRDAAVKGNVHT